MHLLVAHSGGVLRCGIRARVDERGDARIVGAERWRARSIVPSNGSERRVRGELILT